MMNKFKIIFCKCVNADSSCFMMGRIYLHVVRSWLKDPRAWGIVALLLVFGSVFASISLVNHACFRTFAYDLGIFNHAMYGFAHWKFLPFSLSWGGNEVNYFGDHFGVLSVLMAQSYWIFGNQALLIMQILGFLAGSVGVYRYAHWKGAGNLIAFTGMVHYLGIWGITSALAFDFHYNAFAAALLPWFVLAYEQKRRVLSILWLLMMLFAKDNMAIWMAFVILGLEVNQGFSGIPQRLKFFLPVFTLCIAYFLTIEALVIPNLVTDPGLDPLRWYDHLGKSPGEIIKFMLSHPIDTIKMMWINTSGDQSYNGIKQETWFMITVSGGLCLLVRPAFALMLVPVLLQKLLSNKMNLWGISYQYSVEFVPVLALAFVDTGRRLNKCWQQWIMSALVILPTYYFHFRKLEDRTSKWYHPLEHQFYLPAHYESAVDRTKVETALQLVPDDAIVSAGSNLVPRLAFRDRIYLFPWRLDTATFVVVFRQTEHTFPLGPDEYAAEVAKLTADSTWIPVHDQDNLLILKKKN